VKEGGKEKLDEAGTLTTKENVSGHGSASDPKEARDV